MSTLALMRWLESSPKRYDRGMRLLTLGRITRLYEAVACAAAPSQGRAVLEIGCGTGAVTERLVARGALVTALDQDPSMLEIAHARLERLGITSVSWLETTALEIDRLAPAGFDTVVLSLCLSDMSVDERRVVLRHAGALMNDGGKLVVADEVQPKAFIPRWVSNLARWALALPVWLFIGAGSRPLRDPCGDIRTAGLQITIERRWLLGGLAMFVAEKGQ